MDTMWAPWRSQYVTNVGEKDEGKKNHECVFCSALKAENDLDRYIIHRGTNAYVILNLYPYNNGHMLIIPNVHESVLEKLPMPVLYEMMDLIVKAQHVLWACYHPQGINVGLNMGVAAGAGIDQHLHFHILPRWSADSNFMTTIGKTRVIPESLEDSWKKIRGKWAES